MGLLYVFPVSKDEEGFYHKKNNEIIIKSYGLPYIFWIYALLIFIIVALMFFAIKSPIMKLISLGDEVDALLGMALLFFIGLIPFSLMCFFFYEKQIIRTSHNIVIKHKIFGLQIMKDTHSLDTDDTLEIKPYLSSPNIARLNSVPENKGFQNKGYFILYLKKKDGDIFQLDRHSRKVDLEKLKILLEDI